MTTVGYRPMSDPFARDTATRYSAPPLPYPSNQVVAPIPPFKPQSAASSKRSSPAAQSGRTPPVVMDDFGAYKPTASTSHSTSAAKVRSSHSPNVVAAGSYVDNSASISAQQAQAQRHRNRQSHNPHNPSATLGSASPPKPEYLTDEYVLHPSVWSYKQAHPKRPMVGFGPYVLLQTLGEGEFGKVKLGVHTLHGVECAIKLIRRGSLEDESRANKVEREIDVLKSLKHPNIVRMFDVIDTEKYIGIVLEFAGGGELFDHILANRYLKERDAAKLFAQLISGVDYLHKKHIIHRDLKLENLLLDKNRNIIITDFGFANRFDHEQDDLMATSCLYVGSAVDIWSCGVILYAMLSGYLPYDDDPANPDGDNINLLYKYIMSTKLNFPDHLSESVKSLLEIMLVPEPEDRCRITDIISHPWLEAHRHLFIRSIPEQEYIFHARMEQKSLAAQAELEARRKVQRDAKDAIRAQRAMEAMARSQSSLPGSTVTASMLDDHRKARATRHHSAMPGTTTMPQYLNNAGRKTPPLATRQPLAVPPAVPAAAQTSPIIADAAVLSSSSYPSRSIPAESSIPLAPPAVPSSVPSAAASTDAVENVPLEATAPSTPSKRTSPPRPPMSANKNRHTIQVEYDGEASYERMKQIATARKIAAGGASVPTLSFTSGPSTQSSPTKRVLELQAATSDIEMESESSDQGHTQEGTFESYNDMSEEPTPEASHILTPPATADPPIVVEAAPETTVPSTPTKKGKEPEEFTSPSTPKASKAEPEDLLTPRANPDTTPRVLDAPRSGGKRFDSMPTRSHNLPPVETAPLPADRSGLDAAGLPKVPPPKRERGRKGMSLDKFGLAKLLGSAYGSSSVDVSRPPPSAGAAAVALQNAQIEPVTKAKRGSLVRPKTAGEEEQKKNRRKTLQLMVNRSSSIRDGKSSTTATPSTPAPLSARDMNPASTPIIPQPSVSAKAGPSPPIIVEAEGIQPTPPAHGQSAASIVTVDNFAARQAEAQKQPAASSSAAKKVMDWFRRKSLAKDTLTSIKTGGVRSDSTSSFVQVSDSPVRAAREHRSQSAANLAAAMSSTSSVGHVQETSNETDPLPDSATLPKDQAVIQSSRPVQIASPARVPLGPAASKTNIAPVATASSNDLLSPPRGDTLPMPPRSKSLVPDSAMGQQAGPASTIIPTKVPLRSSPTKSADEIKMRVHTGLVDQSALSSKKPREVMAEVLRVLQEMGMDIKKENEFRLRCTRARKRKSSAITGLGLGSVMSVGSTMGTLMSPASVPKTDARGLPMPSTSSSGLLSGGGLKGMLLRRGSSYSSTHPNLPRSDSDILGSPSASSAGFGSPTMTSSPNLHEPIYGEHSIDSGDEVKFVVELCRMKNLPGLYLLTIKRLRGNVWSFKFIYQTTIERCLTLTH